MSAITVLRSRTGRLWGVLTLLVAVLAALVGPTGTAYAVASQPAGTAKTTTTATRTAGASTTPTRGTSAATAAKPKLVTKPVAPTKAQLPVRPKADAKALHSAAVRSALAHSSVPSTCSGAVVADTMYPCTTPAGTETYTLTLPNATDLLVVRAASSSSSSLPITVTAPGGSTVSCQQPYWFQAPQCATTQAGTYTLQVQDGGNAFTLEYTALLSDTSCAVANPSFSSPTIQGSLAADATGNCYSLAITSGSVLHVALSSTPYQELSVVVYDATGAQICVDDQGKCTLTGTAPYRVLASDTNANADSYFLQLNSLSNPQGCLAATQQTYGSVPAGRPSAQRTSSPRTASPRRTGP
ncbi:hypothetical protein ABH925_005287 [Streptacidiphilus sp. EB129]